MTVHPDPVSRFAKCHLSSVLSSSNARIMGRPGMTSKMILLKGIKMTADYYIMGKGDKVGQPKDDERRLGEGGLVSGLFGKPKMTTFLKGP